MSVPNYFLHPALTSWLCKLVTYCSQLMQNISGLIRGFQVASIDVCIFKVATKRRENKLGVRLLVHSTNQLKPYFTLQQQL